MKQPIPTTPSLSSWFSENRDRFIPVAANYVGDTDAEDVIQDAAMRILRLRNPVHNPLALCRRVVVSVSLDWLRRRKRQHALQDAFAQSTNPGSTSATFGEMLPKLLTRKQRRAMQLVYYHGLSTTDAAARMHISRRTLRGHVRAALAVIKQEELEDEHNKAV